MYHNTASYGGWLDGIKSLFGFDEPVKSTGLITSGGLYNMAGGENVVLQPVFTDPNYSVSEQIKDATVASGKEWIEPEPDYLMDLYTRQDNEIVGSKLDYIFTKPPTAAEVAATPITKEEPNFLETAWDYWIDKTANAYDTVVTGGLNNYRPPDLVPPEVRVAAAETRKQQEQESNTIIMVAALAVGAAAYFMFLKKKTPKR